MSEIPRAQLEAMCRLLVDSGDLTPMGQRQLLRLVSEGGEGKVAPVDPRDRPVPYDLRGRAIEAVRLAMHDRGRAGFVETLVDAVLAVLPTSDLTPLQAKLDEMVAVATEAGGKSDATEAVSLAATVLLDWATELRATLALPGVPGEQ